MYSFWPLGMPAEAPASAKTIPSIGTSTLLGKCSSCSFFAGWEAECRQVGAAPTEIAVEVSLRLAMPVGRFERSHRLLGDPGGVALVPPPARWDRLSPIQLPRISDT